MDLHPKIPGATPLDDVSGLRIKGIKTVAERDAAEYENMAEAGAKYLGRKPTRRMAPFTRSWMLKLHKQAFGRVWTWAGQIRKTEKNIGLCLPPYQIEIALEQLARDVAYWGDHDDMGLMEQVGRLHYRAVAIHPFEDCNGRWARLLANIWQRQRDGTLTAWPEKTIRQTTSIIREEYLAALRGADRGDLAALIALHERLTDRTGA